MDVKLPGMDGLAALVEVRRVAPRAKFIVMTAHGTLDTAVRAMKLGRSSTCRSRWTSTRRAR